MYTAAAAEAGSGQAAVGRPAYARLPARTLRRPSARSSAPDIATACRPLKSTSACESRSWAACGAFSHWITGCAGGRNQEWTGFACRSLPQGRRHPCGQPGVHTYVCLWQPFRLSTSTFPPQHVALLQTTMATRVQCLSEAHTTEQCAAQQRVRFARGGVQRGAGEKFAAQLGARGCRSDRGSTWQWVQFSRGPMVAAAVRPPSELRSPVTRQHALGGQPAASASSAWPT